MDSKPGKIESTGQADAFAPYYGTPMLSISDPTSRYLGRVVIELYESPNSTDERGLAYTIDPSPEGGVDAATLAKRIAQAFAVHVTKSPLIRKLEGRKS